MNKQIDEVIKKQYGLSDAEYPEYVKLQSEAYYRLRKLQVYQQLAIAHGCSCTCDDKDAEIERLKLNQGWNK